MCGIAGIVARNHTPIDYIKVLSVLSHRLRHRGKDGEGFFVLDANDETTG